MNRTLTMIAAGAFLAVSAVQAQTDNPLSTEAKQAYTSVKNNLLKAAEKMPEEDYAFKPTPDIRSFGQLIAHIADSQTRTCAAVKGEQKTGSAASKTAKADLVRALQEAFAECDSAFNSLTDETASSMIKTPRGQRTKLGALAGNTIHDNEEYGYLAVYMRLKGLVPPSSEGR